MKTEGGKNRSRIKITTLFKKQWEEVVSQKEKNEDVTLWKPIVFLQDNLMDAPDSPLNITPFSPPEEGC